MFLIFRAILTACLLTSSICSISQIAPQPLNSATILKTGEELYNQGKFKEAISEFKKVPANDTNYNSILGELASSYYSDSNFTEAKKVAEEGLKYFPEKASEWYNYIANNLEGLGRQQEALNYYDKIIKNYTNPYLAWFNKGITYYNLKQFDEAKKCFQQAALINPYYSYTHFYLGNIALNEGNIVGAMLSYITNLAVKPENKYSKRSISSLNSIAQMTDEVAARTKARKQWNLDDFEMVQEIVSSKIALDKQYKLKADLEDVIVRQLQVVFEKMEYKNSDNGFWMQYYVPLYQKIYKQDQFEPFVFYIFSGVNISSIQTYVKKNKNKIDEMASTANIYFDELKTTQVLNVQDRKEVSERYLYGENGLVGKGKWQVEGKNTLYSGPWQFYYPTGQLKSKGLLTDNEKKSGEWTYYHENGVLKEKSVFKEGLLNGESITYFDNGQVAVKQFFNSDSSEGMLTRYYFNGLLNKTETYKNNKKDGIAKGYTRYGTLDYVDDYKGDKQDGIETTYYMNGQPSSTSLYKTGLLEGSYKAFFLNGTLKLEGNFKDDKRTGIWKEYFNSGKLKSTSNYVDGEMNGTSQMLYENGKVSANGNYVKNKLDGKYEDFDFDGKLYSESYYEKGHLKELKYFDKEAKLISNTTTRNGAAKLITFDPYGNKVFEGNYTKDGMRSGKGTFYYPNGKVETIANYKDDDLEGERISYYTNGNIEEKVNYNDDKENGYKFSYYLNGQLKHEGLVINGALDGLQIDYDMLGNVASKMDYRDNELYGFVRFYHPNGKLDLQEYFNSGWLMEVTQFDTLGKILFERAISNDIIPFQFQGYNGKSNVEGYYNGHELHGEHKALYPDGTVSSQQYYKYGIRDSLVKSYYPNGKIEFEGAYKTGEKDGTWTYYFENGNLFYKEVYDNGRLNGVTKLYNDNGTLNRDIPYHENAMEGNYIIYGDKNEVAGVLNYLGDHLMSYTYYDKSGNLLPAIPVKNGTANVVMYYKDGIKSAEISFQDHEVNGSRKVYFTNGKVFSDITRISGNDHGVNKTYYSNGNLSKEESYYYGNLHGPAKKYYENGKLKAEENWYNGEQHGQSKHYSNDGKLIKVLTYYYGSLQSVTNL